MLRVGDALREARVGAIYLLHGTFAGYDALGMLTELGRWYPAGRDSIAKITKQLVDALAGDCGNYTSTYAAAFQQAISRENARPIPVRLFNWSSENHHLGRADGAVRLLDELASAHLEPGQRLLLWGHSHAGNVFAILTNLLASDAVTLGRFFDACRLYYCWPLTGVVDIPVWRRVQERLAGGQGLPGERPLDLVTFGTPIRYGWETDGYARLLHFVNHRLQPGVPDHLTRFPPTAAQLLRAEAGDYVQHFGIAGTNTIPSPLALRAFKADWNLNELLQPGILTRDLFQRLSLGMRVPNEGTTLLVDYGPTNASVARHLLGHAVYTQTEWLLFHAEEIARRFYGLP